MTRQIEGMNLPRVTPAARRPCSKRPANHCDLPSVIAVVRGELPQKCFESVRALLVTGVRGFYLTIEISSTRICKCRRFAYECGKSFSPFLPFSITRRRCCRKAFGIMFRIRGFLTARTVQIVVHPIIHVEDELCDRVRKSGYVACGQLGGKIFDANQGIGVRALAVKQFSKCAG